MLVVTIFDDRWLMSMAVRGGLSVIFCQWIVTLLHEGALFFVVRHQHKFCPEVIRQLVAVGHMKSKSTTPSLSVMSEVQKTLTLSNSSWAVSFGSC